MRILFTRKDVAVLAGLGVIGIAVVLVFGQRELTSNQAMEQSRRSALAAVHAEAVQEFLSHRTVVVGTLAAALLPPPIEIGQLSVLATAARTLLPQATAIAWVARVEKSDLDVAQSALAAAGVSAAELAARLRSEDDGPWPRFLILDVVPKSAKQPTLGMDVATISTHRAAIEQATQKRGVVASEPAGLIEEPNSLGIVLYAPMYANAGDHPAGFVAVTYRLKELIQSALLQHVLPTGLSGSLFVGSGERILLGPGDTMPVPSPDRPIRRQISFAGKSIAIEYAFHTSAARQAFDNALRPTGVVFLFVLLVWASIAVMLGILRRLSQEETRLAVSENNLELLLRELNHRLVNLLQVVGVLVRNTFASAGKAAGPADVQVQLLGRLEALGRAIRIGSKGSTSGLSEMAATEAATTGDRLTYTGPDLVLSPKAAQMLGLLLHELTTNAAKHGALSSPSGRVRLEWSIERQSFVLRWVESGGPSAQRPRRKGFGGTVINKIVPGELGGSVSTDFAADGFRLELRVPLTQVTAEQPPDDDRAPGRDDPPASERVRDMRGSVLPPSRNPPPLPRLPL